MSRQLDCIPFTVTSPIHFRPFPDGPHPTLPSFRLYRRKVAYVWYSTWLNLQKAAQNGFRLRKTDVLYTYCPLFRRELQ